MNDMTELPAFQYMYRQLLSVIICDHHHLTSDN